MDNAIVGRLDEFVGHGIETAVTYKHRRRLRRLGWDRVFEDSTPGVFAAGDPPPREGCELEVLIDGANALPVIAEAISQAEQFVHITGWHLAPSFELVRAQPHHQAIGVLLAEMAQTVDVRVLVWSGAPFRPFTPPARRSPRPCATCGAGPGSRPTATRGNTRSTAITRRP